MEPITFDIIDGEVYDSREFLKQIQKEKVQEAVVERKKEEDDGIHRCFHGQKCLFLKEEFDIYPRLICTKINKGLAGLRSCPQGLWSFSPPTKRMSAEVSWYENNKRLHRKGTPSDAKEDAVD